MNPEAATATELRRFLDRYLEGPTTYSWQWDRHDDSTAGSVAWLLAQGTEAASSEGRVEHHPYRMTMVLERRDAVWLLRLVHGSSPTDRHRRERSRISPARGR